jgi:putative transposase
LLIASAKKWQLNSQGSGTAREERRCEARIWQPRTAKYRQRYPEAVRSLMEAEEHLLTFYAFPPVMHRSIRTTNAIESF